ncbi:MAG: choice-of-anchor B family protein, partial [Bacteroidota bacterium]|nr:choice-of-anchor B family protein [Bacteroidota bacterium]
IFIMKKLLLILFILFITITQIYSQSGFRIKLLGNLNPYPLTGLAYSALWGYTAADGREYAILGCLNGTSFIDITDSTNIHEADFLPLPSGVGGSIIREMKTYSHYAYISSESTGSNIQVVDLQYLPGSVRYVGKIVLGNHSTTHTISQSGPYLYLNGGNAAFSPGVTVVDLSVNPEAPVLRGKWNELYVHDCRIVNDTIWACNVYDGKVTIIDARNKDSLRTIRNWVNYPQPNLIHNIALTNDRRYALVTDEEGFPTPGRLRVWNVSDLNSITYVTYFDPAPFETAVVHNVEVYNNFAFLAYYAAGVKVLNISNPENPVEIGWFDTYPENNSGAGCWAVYFFPTSKKIIASDMFRGLFVLKPDLSDPVEVLPRVDFTLNEPEVFRRDSIRLIDMTEGVPVSWQWTVTGPQTKTSTLRHPKFAFDSAGYYSVKLKATNLFGSDSVTKTNFFRIKSAPLTAFSILNPLSFTTIITSPNDTGRVLFNWRKSVNHSDLIHKMIFKKVTGTNEVSILSGINGRDTFALLTKSYLDTIALQLGSNGDSIDVYFRVRAYLGSDSVTSSSIIITLSRNSTGIQNISEVIPKVYKLYNNYPNPFNPVTKIKFDIPFDVKRQTSNVKLNIYNSLGKEVKTLINENLPAGSYEYSFNAEALNSGIYFVKLSAGGFNSVIKIVLIK